MRSTLLCLLLCSAALSGCNKTEEAPAVTAAAPATAPEPAAPPADPAMADLAEQVVPQFHLAYMDKVYASIYNSSAPDMRLLQPQHEFVAYMERIRARMGQVQAANRKSATAAGNVVTLRYDTKYEGGAAVEEFIVRISGKDAALLGYRMISPTVY